MTKQMVKAISDMVSANLPCIVAGDFNFPDICWSSSPVAKSAVSKSFLELCLTHTLSQVVNAPTHGDRILDLVLCNEDNIIDNISILPPLGSSDHSTINFHLRLRSEPSPKYFLKRDYKTANYDNIVSYLADVDWLGSFDSVPTVNEKYELFIAVLSHCIELFVPLRRVPVSKSYLPQHLSYLYQMSNDKDRRASGRVVLIPCVSRRIHDLCQPPMCCRSFFEIAHYVLDYFKHTIILTYYIGLLSIQYLLWREMDSVEFLELVKTIYGGQREIDRFKTEDGTSMIVVDQIFPSKN
ncbi:hypothetical protein Y032_0462g1896 [Ancylostoma ceylanicum]|uniref:Endonuclease/exonuclease/phosphatase domain-containing protein n=2 Tax=Ancylostoma ceylanicum TaxID=53326 RepID=A0A016WZF5_9BILA|nr:hypothetical protein Y032_0462g1896 [Ancylostoma ceylanicum]